MLNFPLKPTDSDVLRHIKLQAIKYVNELQDYHLRKLRYDYMNNLITFLDNIDDNWDTEVLEKGSVYYLLTLQEHIKYFLNFVPLINIKVNHRTYWTKDNTHVYAPYIHRHVGTDIENPTYYYNANAYHINVVEIFDANYKEVFQANDIMNQDKMLISRNGIVNGEYVDICKLKNVDDENGIKIELPILIPCIKFIYKIDNVEHTGYAVDSEEPTLTKLELLYDVVHKTDSVFVDNPINLTDWYYNWKTNEAVKASDSYMD